MKGKLAVHFMEIINLTDYFMRNTVTLNAWIQMLTQVSDYFRERKPNAKSKNPDAMSPLPPKQLHACHFFWFNKIMQIL
jgi:hypothetical protein